MNKGVKLPLIWAALLYIFIFFNIISGAARYYLYERGFGFLPYFINASVFLLIVLNIFLGFDRKYCIKVLITLAFLITFSLIYNPIGVSVFGTYILSAFLWGIFCVRYDLWPSNKLIFVFSGTTILGILLDYYIKLPWAGFQYELGGVSVEGNREWGYLGLERYSGFARTSYDTASLIALSYIMYLHRLRRASVFSFTLGAIFLLAIWVTTTKGLIPALLATILLSNLPLKKTQGVLSKVVIFASLSYAIALPFANVVKVDFYGENFLLASLYERISYIWPEAISRIPSLGYMFGTGIGSAGMSQAYFGDSSLFTPGDNIMVYLLVNFGVVGIVLFSWLVMNFVLKEKLFNHSFFPAAIVVTIYGWVANIFEIPAMGICLGMIIGYIFNRTGAFNEK